MSIQSQYPFTLRGEGIALYAVIQFKEKFEKQVWYVQQMMFNRGALIIGEKLADLSVVPKYERDKVKYLETIWKWKLFNSDSGSDLLDRATREKWWFDIASVQTSMTLMEIIKTTFHDIVIPDEVPEFD